MQDVKMIIEAPDVHTAAAVLIKNTFYNGKGDRSAFFNAILSSNPSFISDIGRKLKLVTVKEYFGHKIYNDKLCQTLQVN